jgi:hypothetical protein
MSDHGAKISFRFVGAADVTDALTREFTEQNLQIPDGAHVPRIGEIVELTHWDARRDIQVATYIVLSVFTRLALFDGKTTTSAWHTTVTVGEPPADIDTRFLRMS